ncbi:C-type lectin domain-containing protein [Caenorhabditis elegans]|uniref:C-type lectin domain-containing protein n=1 Tax=Caenorhabditis elegans TaxID=6239 RepID=Q18821_CAEEL|nr:C-type lectin domain-containing protein [Caenorhabditis elegans]CCD66849.1 C-type lectin domain-containing protein [Caenorhabditis elegans]|eukprot:NP_509202.1 C-type LECtin [Caenorhabditis elegans]
MLRVLFFTLVALLCFVSPNCLPGDTPFEIYCFSYNRVHGTFNDSDAHCLKTVGGSLVSIHSMIENNWIQKLAVDNLDADYDLFWIGGSDEGHTNDWRWTDGSVLNFTNPGPGQPLEDRHCGAMQLSTGRWFSDLCTVKHQFLCQYPNGAYPTGGSYTCPPCPSCSK